jgi:CBS domain-containing protein
MPIVREVMSKNVTTVTPDTLVKDAAALLAEKDVSGMPVVDGGRVVGIFSEADILKSLRTTKKMVQRGIHRLPVVEKNTLVGILTRGDVIRGLAKEDIEKRAGAKK